MDRPVSLPIHPQPAASAAAAASPGPAMASSPASSVMDPQRASLLTKMPLEVILRINQELSTVDFGALRRTCKLVEKALFNTFSREYFFKKQFMLTEPSLQALIDISHHRTLGPCLRHVIIGLNRFEDPYRVSGRRFHSADHQHRHRLGFSHQFTLVNSGHDRDMLTEAFRSLPNLDKVDIRDFHSDKRWRDGPDARWSSYGAPTVRHDTGLDMVFPFGPQHSPIIYEFDHFPSRAFCTVLVALALAGARPRHLEVVLRHRWGLRDFAFNVPPYHEDAVAAVLANLDAFLVPLDLIDTHPHLPPSGATPDAVCSFPLAAGLLGRLAKLDHLRLNFQSLESASVTAFFQWLARRPGAAAATAAQNPPPPTMRFLPATVAYPALRQLEIGLVALPPRILLPVIVKFSPTLESLSLWKMTLRDSNVQDEDKLNMWARLFAKLERLPRLRQLSVGWLSQSRNQAPNSVAVYFGRQRLSQNRSRSFRGSTMGMKDFLADLVRDTEPEWPKTPPPASPDESEGDNEDEEPAEDLDEEEEESDTAAAEADAADPDGDVDIVDI